MYPTDKTKETLLEELENSKKAQFDLEKKCEELKAENLRLESSFSLLNETLVHLTAFSSELAFKPYNEVFSFIVSTLKKIFNVKYAWITSYDEVTSELVVEYSSLSLDENAKVMKLIGSKLLKLRTPVSEKQYKRIATEVVGLVHSVHELTFGAIPDILGKTVEKLFGIGGFIGIGLIYKERLVGTMVIAFGKDQKPPEKDYIKVFSSIASNAIGRKKAEEKLRSNQERFKLLVQNSNDILQIIDAKGNTLYIGEQIKRILGYEPEEFIRENVFSKVHPEDLPPVMKILQEGIEIPGAVRRAEYRYQHKNGNWVYMEAIGQNLLFDPSVNGIVLNVRDITDRKIAEDALVKSEERFRLLVQNSNDIIEIIDSSGCPVYIGDQIYRILGYKPDELIGTNNFSYLHPDDYQRVIEDFSEALKNPGEVRKIDFRFRHKNGSWLDMEAVGCNLLHDPTVNGVVMNVRDISERKKADEILRERDQQFSAINEASPDALLVTRLSDGVILHANEQCGELVGLPAAELIGRRTPDFYTNPDDRKLLLSEIETGKRISLELSLKRKDGTPFWAMVTARMGSFEGFNVIYAGIRDITDRKQTDEAIGHSLSMLTATLESTTDAILVVDLEGKIVNFNKKFLELWQFPPELIPAGRSRDLISDDLEQQAVGLVLKQLKDHHSFVSKVNQLYSSPEENSMDVLEFKDGRIIERYSQPQWIEGKPIGRVWSFRDVTEKKIAEEELKDINNLLSMFIKQSPVYSYIKSVTPNESRVIFASENFVDMIGVKGTDMVGKTMEELFPVDFARKITEDDWNVVAGGKIIELEENLNSRNYITIKFPINQEKRSLLAGYTIDITERKRAEGELRKIAKLESLGIMAGGIAHNFKNLLASVSLNSSLARMKPENMNKYLEKIDMLVEQASALATRFQTFSSGGEPIKELTDLKKIIIETESMVMSGSNIIAEFDFAPDLKNIEADPKQLNEVFTNLLINARQAMPIGGTIYISVSNYRSEGAPTANLGIGNFVKASIKDSGIGIPDNILAKIFDPFFTTKQEGHGLGLSSVQYIISKHGGYITVDSEPGKGTRFDVYLPSSESVYKENGNGKEITAKGHLEKILLMDDESHIRESVIELGEVLNYRIIGVENGEEAVKKYLEAQNSEDPFKAVILDLTVKGGMGGEETLIELLKIDPHVKAIVFSGHSLKSIVANYQDYGFKAKLAKPATMSSISKILEKVLRST